MIPHCAPPDWPEPIAPGRFASLVRTDTPDGCAVALLGLADDTGVALNGGRPGARDGPDALRHALARLGGAQPASGTWPIVFDAGNIIAGETLDETHERVTSATSALIELGLSPIGIGGGHDLTFPFVRAMTQHCAPMTGVYLDPHLDVRDEPGSGMRADAKDICEPGGVPLFQFKSMTFRSSTPIKPSPFVSAAMPDRKSVV